MLGVWVKPRYVRPTYTQRFKTKALSAPVLIFQELCESRGGRPGLSVLTSLMFSVHVKLYWTMLRYWSQLVPNMSADMFSLLLPLLSHSFFYMYMLSLLLLLLSHSFFHVYMLSLLLLLLSHSFFPFYMLSLLLLLLVYFKMCTRSLFQIDETGSCRLLIMLGDGLRCKVYRTFFREHFF